MMYESINGFAARGNYVNHHYGLPMTFTVDPSTSAIYSDFSEEEIEAVRT